MTTTGCQHRFRMEWGAQPRGAQLQALAPSAITLLGLALSLWWLCGGPLLAAGAGVLCDGLDGWLARRLGAESEFGSLLDWTVDVVVAALVLHRLGALPLLLVALPLQVWLRRKTVRVSGRAVLVALAVGWRCLRG